ncbi:hypothetical protein [Zobellella maritima]|uniref:hypothetical protein n=1 Tax=Zobellella maritima TaxID=2059725 RepID=UPI0013006D66|nr:hypothetical protein [Zobellella maritima]
MNKNRKTLMLSSMLSFVAGCASTVDVKPSFEEIDILSINTLETTVAKKVFRSELIEYFTDDSTVWGNQPAIGVNANPPYMFATNSIKGKYIGAIAPTENEIMFLYKSKNIFDQTFQFAAISTSPESKASALKGNTWRGQDVYYLILTDVRFCVAHGLEEKPAVSGSSWSVRWEQWQGDMSSKAGCFDPTPVGRDLGQYLHSRTQLPQYASNAAIIPFLDYSSFERFTSVFLGAFPNIIHR